MNCSINVRLELIKAGFASYHISENQSIRRELAEGIFWLCNGIQEELEEGKHPQKDYCVGYLSELTQIAEDVFKGGGSPEELHKIDNLCIRIASCLIDPTAPA
jgi:hypothetical protein